MNKDITAKKRGILLTLFLIFYLISYFIAVLFNGFVLYFKAISLPLRRFPWLSLLGIISASNINIKANSIYIDFLSEEQGSFRMPFLYHNPEANPNLHELLNH